MLFLTSLFSYAFIQAPPGDFRPDYESERGYVDPYIGWVWGVLTWDLGRSSKYRMPIEDLVKDHGQKVKKQGILSRFFEKTKSKPS